MRPTWLRWLLVPLLVLFVAVAAGGAPPLSGPEIAAVDQRPGVTLAASDLTPPRYERDVAKTVAEFLQGLHYNQLRVDDALSRRWFDLYIDRLDYERMVFLQSDIDRFRDAYAESLDDAVSGRTADVEAAVVIYETYRQRMRDRMTAARGFVEQGVDLTNDESWMPDRHDHASTWPTTDAEADDLWRQRVEEDFIVGLLDGQEQSEITDRLLKRYDRYLRTLEDTESTDVMSSWLGALGAAYDPHSQWLQPARNDDFDISITNSVSGIGAQLQTEGDYIVVKEVIPGGPAFKSKVLKSEDKILAVSQGRDEPVDVVGLRIDKVVKLIRGEVGTEVKLEVEHADGKRELIPMVRARVTLEDSATEHKVIEIDGHKLGVVDLPSFYVDPEGRRNGRRASADVQAALTDLRKQGVEGVVLDLRENGGGSLIEAIDVAGLFITRGPVVQVRSREGNIEALQDRDPQVHWLGPMVVLTDPTSASASEIVAGALQDYGRAVVVGSTQTHGKGTVQQVAPLTRALPGKYTEDVGGALKLTIQKFYRVSGGSTQNRGVHSDVVLPSPWDGLDVYEKDLDYALPYDEIPPAPHIRLADLSTVIPKLQRRSAKRVAASEDFDKLKANLAERDKLRNQTLVSLNLQTRRADYESREARLGHPPAQLPAVDSTGLVDGEVAAEQPEEEPNDFILSEAVAVLADLVELTGR